MKCLGVFANTKGDSRAWCAHQFQQLSFPGGMLCHVMCDSQSNVRRKPLFSLSPIKRSALLASWTEFPEQNSSKFSIMCSSTYARVKVYFKRWQQTRILWKISWKVPPCSWVSRELRNTSCCCVWTRGCPLPPQQFCNPGCSTWLSWSRMLPVHSHSPQTPQTWGCTCWDSSEGSQAFLTVHTL